jgi:NAD(P)-dependent dehydrogenase (short-subunit alcohol dehydrogenase family)
MTRLALITGGARGIGAETARILAKDGLTIAIADRNLAGAEAVVAELGGAGHSAWQVDVTDESSVIGLFDKVEAAKGPIAVLACIAGGPYLHQGVAPNLAEATLDTWIGTEALNGRGTFLCMREMMRRRKARPLADARMIGLSSRAGQMPSLRTGPSYAAAKAAIIGLARYAALEAAPLGMTVNVVSPGMIDTPAVRDDLTDEQFANGIKQSPLGMVGQPINIAKAISYIVSPEAGYMTGAIIEVNGGTHFA